jgi:hypothetical protein
MIEITIIITIFIAAFSLYSHFVSYNVGGDATSMYYPAKQLLAENDLNMWDPFNDRYETYYFKMTFGDNVIYDWGEIYPTQTLGTIFIEAFPLMLFGDSGFFLLNSFFAGLIACLAFLTCRELDFSLVSSSLASLAVMSMPLLFYWAVIPQNIMPASFFLILSIYLMVRYREREERLSLILAGIAFGIGVIIRPTHALFVLGFLPFLYDRVSPIRLNLRSTMMFILPMLIVGVVLLIGNFVYFGDPLFQGYLFTDYHPVPPGESIVQSSDQVTEKYFIDDFSLEAIWNSTLDLFIGSTIVYFPLLIPALIGVIIAPIRTTRFKLVVLLSVVPALLYYGQLSPLLYRPDDLVYSIDITFFRYMLPALLIIGLGVAPFMERLLSSLKVVRRPKLSGIVSVAIVALFIIAIIGSARLTYYYDGGASLRWYEEISDQIEAYSEELEGKLDKGSTILFDTRWSFSFTYPNLTEYHWFYYDGVPQDYRNGHTAKVVEELLLDNETVYFASFGPPYNTLSQPMEDYLSGIFDLVPLNDTSFPRMKFVFKSIGFKSGGAPL